MDIFHPLPIPLYILLPLQPNQLWLLVLVWKFILLLVLIGILVFANLNAHRLLFGVLVWLLVINNGIILQYGSIETCNHATITLPTTYTNNYVAVTTNNSNYNRTCNVTNRSLSDFYVTNRNRDDAERGCAVSWMTIGY